MDTGTKTKDTFNQLKDPKNLKRKIGHGNVFEETSQPSNSREKMPSTSKESNQSTSGEGILSASKQQDKAASRDWVEAEIVSSRQEETIIVQAREIGQGPIQNQNIQVMKKQRNINVKESDSKGQNNHGHVQHNLAEDQNQRDANLSAPSPTKRNSNVHNFLNGAINEEVQVPQNATSSEAFEIVSQLLESLLINLKSDSELWTINPQTLTECFDLQSAEITVKVDGLSTEESLTNTSLDIATPSTVDQKENMATTSENPDTVKVLPRRSVIEKQIEEVCIQKCEEEETKEHRNANNYNNTSEPTEIAGGAEGKSEPRNICEIRKGGGGNRRQNTTVGGQVLVDTTKRLRKKDLHPNIHYLINFRIHESFDQDKGQKEISPGKCQEIEVLNYQTLAYLRRKIMCDTAGDVSSTPVATIAKQKFKSGLFYINETFYVDTRERSEDYTEVIRKWAKEHFIQTGERKPMAMEEVQVCELEVKLGCPYIYIHQGSCEHLIVISGARPLTENKSLYSSDYPNLTIRTQSPLYFCTTCTMNLANWIVIGSDQMTHDIHFMCESCFNSFHYIGTQKVGNFKAHKLKQRGILYY